MIRPLRPEGPENNLAARHALLSKPEKPTYFEIQLTDKDGFVLRTLTPEAREWSVEIPRRAATQWGSPRQRCHRRDDRCGGDQARLSRAVHVMNIYAVTLTI